MFEKIAGLLFLALVLALVMGGFTGWLLMLILGAILQGYGIAGPGFFLSWGLAAVLGLICNSNVSTD